MSYRLNKNNMVEGLRTDVSTFGSPLWSDKRKFYGGEFNSTFNGRLSIDDQYFSDKLLSGTIYYPNEYEKGQTMGRLITRGIDKCNSECPGTCVEYGQTSNAWCFTPFTAPNIYQ
ncbi:MAG: hypothetical protein MUO21_03515 [Nitrososphaeraceae archaeon]|nr:hypothetical protein [Nitrososphaeraceae archaeon]